MHTQIDPYAQADTDAKFIFLSIVPVVSETRLGQDKVILNKLLFSHMASLVYEAHHVTLSK